MRIKHSLRRLGPILYLGSAIIAIAGMILNFKGDLRIGSELIGLGLAVLLGTALELGHIKKW